MIFFLLLSPLSLCRLFFFFFVCVKVYFVDLKHKKKNHFPLKIGVESMKCGVDLTAPFPLPFAPSLFVQSLGRIEPA